MPKKSQISLVIPVLIITIGLGWLLTAKGFAGIFWVWTLGLGVVGILTFIASGFDKFSVVVGPFFLAASILSILRQTGRLDIDVEIPSLVLISGVLLLLAQMPGVPMPKWLTPLPPPDSGEQTSPKT